MFFNLDTEQAEALLVTIIDQLPAEKIKEAIALLKNILLKLEEKDGQNRID